MIDSDDIQILAQLIEALNDSAIRLEEYYGKRDIENFNKSKKALLDFQKKIAEMLK